MQGILNSEKKMPYLNEFAKNIGNQKLVASTGLKEMLKVVQFIISDNEHERLDDFVIEEKIKPDHNLFQYAFVIDGSKFETAINEGSEAKMALFNINQCVVDIKEFTHYLKDKFPLPKQYQKIKNDIILNTFLPIRGMRTAEHNNEKDFFRHTLYTNLKRLDNTIIEWLKEHNIEVKHKETLLETYEYLLGLMKDIKNVPHPCPHCRKLGKTFTLDKFRQEIPDPFSDNVSVKLEHMIDCQCKIDPMKLYITDLLGLNEQLQNETSNEALTTQIMLIFEKLVLINLLKILKKNQLKDILEKSIFILDGSLAIYSHAAWLSEAINKEIIDIKNHYNVLVLGVEKTGNFVDHLKKIDSHFATDPLKNGLLFFLNDDYIKEHVKIYDSNGFYGQNNYFGKKLFYKNKNGKLFVINVAFEDEADKVVDLNQRNTEQYRQKIKRLNDIAMLLDNFYSQSYDNALSLISLANDGASLSTSYLGKKLLNDFVQESLKEKE